MSKVLGIVAEYNPFHNGHLYHLEESKKITNSDFVVAVISGNFIQRGSTSIVDKWTKTKMALLCGVDLVLELPTVYSISSAENFAMGAVKILNSLGIVDTISFGAETDNIEILDKIATILYEEPKEFLSFLGMQLKNGLSFPKARENAILMYLGNISSYINVLGNPNNILAIEYLKALKKLKSTITPMCIKRNSVDYNDLNEINNIASATGIREMIVQNDLKAIKKVVPRCVYSILKDKMELKETVNNLNVFEKQIVYSLRKSNVENIKNLPDVSEGLENSIKSAVNSTNNLTELITNIKSKRYTQTRIQRILLYSLLGITKQDMQDSFNVNPYIRILGMNEKGKSLLSKIASNKNVHVISSVKKFLDANSKNKKIYPLVNMLQKDILATDIYSLGYFDESYSNLDYINKIITI